MIPFEFTPQGPFHLADANQYFGGWRTLDHNQPNVVMTFPVEGWQTSAAVLMKQAEDHAITGEVYGADQAAERAWRQALATVSLDCDGRGWPDVGRRDPVIGRLQTQYHDLRPVLFHSPYEAAASFIIGHRITIQQGRAIRAALAHEYGEKLAVGEIEQYAFPQPQVLLRLTEFPSLNPEKVERLHGVARAALEGWLDRALLRAMPVDQALDRLGTLRGVGNFFKQAILYRGAGLVDVVSDDEVTAQAVQQAYTLAEPPDHQAVLQLAEHWRPYRMWAAVLLHITLRRDYGAPGRGKAARK